MKSDFTVGIYGANEYKGGVYDVMSSFTVGLNKALIKANVKSHFMREVLEPGSKPNFTLAFNISGIDNWKESLDLGIPHVMWIVDSPFIHMSTISRFIGYDHFIVISVSPVDSFPMKHFLPNLPYLYVSHGVDPELWYDDNSERVYDLIFMASIEDVDSKISELKGILPSGVFKILIEMYEYSIRNPEIAFWEIYKNFTHFYNIDLDNLSTYETLFTNLCYLATYTKRIKLVKSLKDFNLKVWGSPLWEKYIEGKVEYMGSVNVIDSTEIVRKSKIVLHQQPMQTLLGLHERVLNAMASNSFVLSNNNVKLKAEFSDNIAFYDDISFNNIEEQVLYYLRNEEERTEKANSAKASVLNYYTWENKAKTLIKLLTGQ